MANKKFYIETDGMKEMEDEFERASVPNKPPKSVRKLDEEFKLGSDAVRGHVHIDTGYLVESGRSNTHYVADTWIAEITYAEHPGIFELARGDSPTKFHPTGGHFFFNAIEPFIPMMEETIADAFFDWFSKAQV